MIRHHAGRAGLALAAVTAFLLLALAPPPLQAQSQAAAQPQQATPAKAPKQELGPVTNLPIPRFVSLKASESNVRRGPSLTHRIDWVYKRKDLPLEITAEYGHWRRVRDHDGAGGWVHYALLSGVRTVLVDVDQAEMRMKPLPGAEVTAKAERGVIAKLGECQPDWCLIRVDGYRGWVRKSEIWGVTPDEVHD